MVRGQVKIDFYFYSDLHVLEKIGLSSPVVFGIGKKTFIGQLSLIRQNAYKKSQVVSPHTYV